MNRKICLVLCLSFCLTGCASLFDAYDKYKDLIEPNENGNDAEVVTNLPPDVITNATPQPPKDKYRPDATDNHSFLWKPISDNGKKLVVILPQSLSLPSDFVLNPDTVSFVMVTLSDMETVQESQSKCSSVGNGNRTHWRFKKQGGEYQTNGWAVAVLKDGRKLAWHIAQTGNRTEKRKPDVIK